MVIILIADFIVVYICQNLNMCWLLNVSYISVKLLFLKEEEKRKKLKVDR